MLTDSRLPKSFWWDAYCAAPNLSWLRRWGCKAYVLIPKADRRKDWEDKAMVGYFIGYSKTKADYRILLCDTVVTSVHVLFDECIPERGADYFRELDEATVVTP